MRRALTVAVATILISMLTMPATAHLRSHRDPDDAPGRDIRRVQLSRSHHRVVFDLETWEGRWGYSTIDVEFDSRGDREPDFVLRLSYDGGSGGLAGGLMRFDGTWVPAVVEATCEDGCWFPVSFRAWRLHQSKHLRWRVSATGLDYGQREGEDLAPEVGWYRH